MKRYNVAYVEVIEQDRRTTLSKWYGGLGYGSIGDEQAGVFHELIKSLVVPKVVHLPGNKVTKSSLDLVDGYDCYYTTNDVGHILVCFTEVSTPKIVPLRVLVQLRGSRNVTDEALKSNLNKAVDEFHEELTGYYDGRTADASEQELQAVLKVMNDNIDKFLERQERISQLVDQTSQLNQSSYNFQRKAVRIRRSMWWNNVRYWAIGIFLVTLCGFVAFGRFL